MSDSAESRESSSSSSSDSDSSDEEVNYKRSVKSSVAVKKRSTSERSPRKARDDKEDGALTSEESPIRKKRGSPDGSPGHHRQRRDEEIAERRRQREERHRREKVQDDRPRDRRRDDRREEPRRRDREDRRDRERFGRDNDRRDRRGNEREDERERDVGNDRKRKRDGDEPTGDEEEKKNPEGKKEDNMENFLAAKRAKNKDDTIMTKTGGAYIPPARLRMMQQQITDKASTEYQRLAWEALKKSINGLVNKINVSNIILIVRELFRENIVRGRGVMARSIIQAQAASPTFTHVYAALVAIVNTKFPQNGELILKRLVLNFKKGFRRNDKSICMSSVKFIAHLVNQQVAHEILALELLTLLLENPTDDSVEVAIAFLKESGQKLTEVSPRGMHAIFERLRNILHEAAVDKRVQYMCEVMFATRKDGFKDHPSVVEDLDLVEEEDQFTHMLTLEDAVNSEDMLNIFKFDPEYEANEERYKTLKKEILDEGSSDEDASGSGSGSGSGSDSESGEDEEGEGEGEKTTIIDQTETNLVALRRTIYLTIQSSLDFEECAHKLLKMEFKPGQESELSAMILDCCAQQRTYEKFYGLLAQRFCVIDKKYLEPFQLLFGEQYVLCHRLETNKLRNVAKFFGHLLHSDAMSWEVLCIIKLNEEDTTSSSRIFIKILFQELCEYMGLPKLNTRLKDETLQMYFEGLFPRDNPKNTRFAINFFTSIGLGGLTDELRAHLKSKAKTMIQQQQQQEMEKEAESSSDSSSESSDSSSSSSDSSSSNSDSDDSDSRRKKKKLKKGKENKSPPEASVRDRKKHRQQLDEDAPRLDRPRENRRKAEKRYADDYNNKDDHRVLENDSEQKNKKKKRRDKEPEQREVYYDLDDLEDSRSRSRSHRHQQQDNGDLYYEEDAHKSFERERHSDQRRDKRERSDKNSYERGDKNNYDRSDRNSYEKSGKNSFERGDKNNYERSEKLTRTEERSKHRDRSVERYSEKYERQTEYIDRGREKQRNSGERRREREVENDRDGYYDDHSRDRERRRR